MTTHVEKISAIPTKTDAILGSCPHHDCLRHCSNQESAFDAKYVQEHLMQLLVVHEMRVTMHDKQAKNDEGLHAAFASRPNLNTARPPLLASLLLNTERQQQEQP